MKEVFRAVAIMKKPLAVNVILEKIRNGSRRKSNNLPHQPAVLRPPQEIPRGPQPQHEPGPQDSYQKPEPTKECAQLDLQESGH